MKKILLLSLVVPFFCSVSLAAGQLSDYGYEQVIQLSPVAKSTTVGVVLPMETRAQINDKFSNLDLVNARNEKVAFDLYDREQGMVKEIERVTVSSIREGSDPATLFDNDRLTSFAFDEKVDGADASTILVDFGVPRDIHRIKFWLTNRAQIRGLQIKMGMDPDRLKTAKAESAFVDTVDGNFPPARFVEISFWGPSVKLEDILFYERSTAEVYFTAEPGMSYRLLYGNPAVEVYRFKSRSNVAQSPQVMASLTKPEFNRLAEEDIDGDGVLNIDDNCPMISNKGQKDTDEDGFGDECDNAPKRKNYDQSDVDRDGVSDLIDNCKLVANPGQYDTDKDGIGNFCDTTEKGGESKIASAMAQSGPNTFLLWGGIGILVLLVLTAGAWFVLIKRQK